MRIAIKYCGGCNPRYDRLGIPVRLNKDFPNLNLLAADAADCDYALVVCGCEAKCAQIGKLNGKYGKSVIASLEDYAKLRDTLCRVLDKERFHGLEADIQGKTDHGGGGREAD